MYTVIQGRIGFMTDYVKEIVVLDMELVRYKDIFEIERDSIQLGMLSVFPKISSLSFTFSKNRR
jgi:hypothetical protein